MIPNPTQKRKAVEHQIERPKMKENKQCQTEEPKQDSNTFSNDDNGKAYSDISFRFCSIIPWLSKRSSSNATHCSKANETGHGDQNLCI